ncbi:MAG: hypothetical protein Q8P59_14760 [Dehalococcoidia bacterium]|nr:hypothetical protein [Dehalococcoidia bacterium]
MPAEEKDEGSLQDLLKELLASKPPEQSPTAPDGNEAEVTVKETGEGGLTTEEEAPSGPRQVSSEEELPRQSEGPPPLPTFEVEIIPPEVATSPASAEATSWGSKASQASTRPKAEAVPSLLEGKLQVRVEPPITAARLSSFERALKEHDEVTWLGTWGRPKGGTTLHLQLKAPIVASRLFEGAASVGQLEATKSGEFWKLRVSLSPEGSESSAVEVLPDTAPAQPVEPMRPASVEQQPSGAYSVASGEVAGQTDLEISPIASLDALNRIEKLLTSFSVGCRVANVLSLDGASTVLITLENIGKEVLASKLSENVSGVVVEAGQDRLVARLPEKW